MEVLPQAAIHIDFEINRGDLFRVSLRQAKWRLLIGTLIFLVFAGAVIYFFLLIDEKEILFQTSLLFIGFPLLSVGGQVLRLHATCRKVLNGMPESQRRVHYMFTSEADGFDLFHGDSFSHTSWSDISRVLELPNHYLFYRNRFEAFVIPKRGFHQTSDITEFRSILTSKLGKKARLMK